MLTYLLACLVSCGLFLWLLNVSNPNQCLVILTGESVRVQGCVINEEFGRAIANFKVLQIV
uniref:Movement protein TGBp3 n=1 Tax=Hop latent virus TaxID=104263 RepID=W6MU56_9VIRU|nr:triple gene block protein 3 [Hop latent virus]CDK36474.1 triple gene block protein 3 [Hop latent virus]